MLKIIQEFIDYLNEQVENGSIYVWGGQGQTGSEITQAWIKKREPTEQGAERAIALWEKRLSEGKKNLRAYDCSGLIMYFLQNLKGLYSYDMSSNSIKGKCSEIEKNALQPGDFVFRVYKSGSRAGRAYHVGIVVDENRNVIEAKGRDDGVVKRPLDAQADYWNYFGRPDVWETEESSELGTKWELARLLKRMSPLMKGTDVTNVQKALIQAGYPCGKRGADGEYGDETEKAVKGFQAARKLRVDGIVGEETCKALGGTWKEWELTRLLKRVSPLMKGADVTNVQKELIQAGYPCGKRGADGEYGDETEKAVKSFQAARKLRVDGIVGEETCKALGGIWKG